MKHTLILITLIAGISIIDTPAYANEPAESAIDGLFEKLLKIDDKGTSNDMKVLYKSKFIATLDVYKSKQLKWNNDKKTLEHVFYKTHQKYLKNYTPYQSFAALFDKGTYGCLTATALYSFFLEALGYEYDIIETNYHIFLLVQVDGQSVLIESTDPLNGYIDSEKEINERLKEITSKGAIPSKEDRYRFSFNINRSISLEEIVGLQYYNMASQAYNQGNYIQAVANLDKAYKYYQSERINEFLLLVINSIAEDRRLLIELNLNKKAYPILATL